MHPLTRWVAVLVVKCNLHPSGQSTSTVDLITSWYIVCNGESVLVNVNVGADVHEPARIPLK
jgi:hypothetical protein